MAEASPVRVGLAPGRGLAITGGVLGIVSSFAILLACAFVWILLTVLAAKVGPLDVRLPRAENPLKVYGVLSALTTLALAGFVFGVLACASRLWAVFASVGVHAAFAVICVAALATNPGEGVGGLYLAAYPVIMLDFLVDGRGGGIDVVIPLTAALLAVLFSLSGLRQTTAYRRWQRHLTS